MKKLILTLGILSVMCLGMAACKTNESSVPDNNASVPQASELPGAQASDEMRVLPRNGQVTDGNGIIGDTDDMIYYGNTADNTGNNIGNAADNAARNIGDTINNAADNVGNTVSNITSNAGDVVSNITSNIGDTVSNIADNAGDTVENAADNVGDTVSGR